MTAVGGLGPARTVHAPVVASALGFGQRGSGQLAASGMGARKSTGGAGVLVGLASACR